MNYAIILAGGVGQRMKQSGMPKQFLAVFGKPIIIYTLEKFSRCEEVDKIVIVCNPAWIDHMQELVKRYSLPKVSAIVTGGKDRQGSILRGIDSIVSDGGADDCLVIIHDGVRPLVQESTVLENIKVASKKGCAMTVRPVIETVIITDKDEVTFEDFKDRSNTFSLTSPQTFQLSILQQMYKEAEETNAPIPLLDAALVYSYLGHRIPIVVENYNNIKITTPEDYYVLKALLEMEENRYVFGI